MSKFSVARKFIEGQTLQYTELEYIESSGTLYLYIPLYLTNTDKVIFDFTPTILTENQCLWCSRYDYTDRTNTCFWINDTTNKLRFDYYNNSSTYTSQSLIANTRYLILTNANLISANRIVIGTLVTGTFTTPNNTILFASELNTLTHINLANYGKYKLHNFKVDGKYDLIPVKDPNGVVCMYDKVSETFFYNQGTGNFIAGPEKSNIIITNGTKFLVSHEEFDLKKNVHFLQGDALSIQYTDRLYAIGKKFETLPTVTPQSRKRFVNWQTTSQPIQDISVNTLVDISKLVLSPKFIDLIDMTFDCQGGHFPDSSLTKTLQFAPGYAFSEYTFPADPTKTDKNFDGWYTQLSGEGTKITSSSICPASPTTYYANWKDGYGTMVYCGPYGSYSETDIVLGDIIAFNSNTRSATVLCNGSNYLYGFSGIAVFDFNQQQVYNLDRTANCGNGYQWESYSTYSLNWYSVPDYYFDIYVKMRM